LHISHPLGNKLVGGYNIESVMLGWCDARPTITFPAIKHYYTPCPVPLRVEAELAYSFCACMQWQCMCVQYLIVQNKHDFVSVVNIN